MRKGGELNEKANEWKRVQFNQDVSERAAKQKGGTFDVSRVQLQETGGHGTELGGRSDRGLAGRIPVFGPGSGTLRTAPGSRICAGPPELRGIWRLRKLRHLDFLETAASHPLGDVLRRLPGSGIRRTVTGSGEPGDPPHRLTEACRSHAG